MNARMMYRLKFKNGTYTRWHYSRTYIMELMNVLGGKLEMRISDSKH